MSDTNQITVRGRVGTEPDVLITTNGKEVTKFRLASTRSYRDATTDEWRDLETEWFTVKAWGSAGEPIRQSIHRGMPVIVTGVLSSEEWESGERTHHTNVITVGSIGVDIKYGLVTYNKLTRQTPADNGQATVAGDTAPEEPAAEAAPAFADTTEPAPTSDAVDPWQRSPITT